MARCLILLAILAGCAGEPDASVVQLGGDDGWVLIGANCYRLEVPGGWVVIYAGAYKGGVAFVPDPDKAWKY